MSGMPPESELRMLADGLILVDAVKVELGAGVKIGELTGSPEPQFFITIEGRVNKSQERRSLHLAVKPDLAYKMGDEIMTRLEEFIKLVKDDEQ